MKKLLIGIAAVAVGLAFATSASAVDFGREVKKASKKAAADVSVNEYNKNIKKQNCRFKPGSTNQLTCDINKLTAEIQAAHRAIQDSTKRDVDIQIFAPGDTYDQAKLRAYYLRDRFKVVVPWDISTTYRKEPGNTKPTITLKAN
jgi:hypothetical protein